MTLDGELRPLSTTTDAVVPVQPGDGDHRDDDGMRVVAFFDALLDDEVDAAGLVRRTASFAGCPVGISLPAGLVISAGPSGCRGPGSVPAGAARVPLRRGGEVWLHRPADPHPLDAVVLRRLGVAAGVVLARVAAEAAAHRETLLEQALSDRTPEVDRSRCLRGLRLTVTTTVRVFALAGPRDALGGLVDQIRAVSPTVHGTPLSEVTAVLAEEPAVPGRWDVPVGTHLAWSRPWLAFEAPAAWREARTALRFTLPSTHARGPYTEQEGVMVAAERVGAFAALAEHLRAEDIARNPDVQALDRLVREEGHDTVRILEAVAATESLRRAAGYVHLHHNSVATRVRRAERVLGFSVTEPYGRCRLLLALVLRRLRDTAPRS
ncbi:helix-turn-helix domain-containing protein [Geodermatophilus sp. URMC 60]